MIFSRKKKQPRQQDSNIIEPYPPRYEERQIARALDCVPVSPNQFRSQYFSEFELTLAQIGPRFAISDIPGIRSNIQIQSHDHLAFCFAAEAVRYGLEKKNRLAAWTYRSTIDSDAAWAAAIWRCALAAPLGFLSANYGIQRASYGSPWCPSLRPFEEYLAGADYRVFRSHRPLSGITESYGVYRTLFSEAPLSDADYIMLAVSDALSESRNQDNPITRAMRRALDWVIGRQSARPYPYWWCDFYNYYLSDRDELEPLVAHTTRRFIEPASMESQAIVMSSNPVEGSQSSDVAPVQNNREESAPTMQQAQTPVSLDQVPEKTQRYAAQFWRKIGSLVHDGTVKTNTGGALFHVVEDALHILSPSGWQRAAKFLGISLDSEQLSRLMTLCHYLVEDPIARDYESVWLICPEGRDVSDHVGVSRLVRLSDRAASLVYPNGLPQNNPDLKRRPSNE